jgi:hypothetical protein
MMTRIFRDFKDGIQKQLSESKEDSDFKKYIKKTQKWLHELKEDLNK